MFYPCKNISLIVANVLNLKLISLACVSNTEINLQIKCAFKIVLCCHSENRDVIVVRPTLHRSNIDVCLYEKVFPFMRKIFYNNKFSVNLTRCL